MKTKMVTAIIVTMFLASMFGMAFVTPAKAHYLVDPYTVALWHFDEDEGNTAFDATEYHNDGAIHEASWTTGKFGSALSFDGYNDYVYVSDSPSLDIADEITIEAWINLKAFETERANNYIVDKYHVYGLVVKAGVWESAGLMPQGAISGFIFTSEGPHEIVTTESVISLDQWIHVAFTRSLTTGMHIYVDGVEQDVIATHGVQNPSGPINNGAELYVGQYPAVGYQLNGIIDEVRISSVAREPVDIDPDTLNLKSKGAWISAYIEVPGWTELFKDDFESYAIGSDGSPTWTVKSGAWAVESDTQWDGKTGKVYSQSVESPDRISLVMDPSIVYTDLIYQARVKLLSGYPDAAILFRVQDANNFYMVQIAGQQNELQIYYRSTTDYYQKVATAPFYPSLDTWYTIKAVMVGSTITAYVDGITVSWTDPLNRFTSGYIGLKTWATHTHFDDVIVTSYASEVDLSTVELYVGMDGVAAEDDPKYSFVTDMWSYIADVDGDGTLERMVKFDRLAVTGYLNVPEYIGQEISLTISGSLIDGTPFYLCYTVRVIKPGKQ